MLVYCIYLKREIICGELKMIYNYHKSNGRGVYMAEAYLVVNDFRKKSPS